MSNLNWVDIVVLIVFAFSVLAGLMRGFVKEVLSLITWVVAFFVAAMFATKVASFFTGSPQVQAMVSSASSSIGMNAAQPVSILSIGLSFILIFVVVLVIGSIITSIVSTAVSTGGMGLINRLLGALFGLARGFLIVLVVMFLLQLTSIQQQAFWTQSQFVNSFQPAIAWVSGIVSPSLATLKEKMSNTMQNTGQMLRNATDSLTH